ncbi:hypothetical protein CPS_2639 [Colwellia psychrerythraea 34H]|uniref:Uncharacterized protein n=1 Tax=Colwellia psychrerythraea (strain 34H / ATCC BAA-681) TaxID=167879 RepID=Q481B6_COLP3|nr:hypothetical protein CPS_2639 [Colwellia psychrerythraea 34H]
MLAYGILAVFIGKGNKEHVIITGLFKSFGQPCDQYCESVAIRGTG